MRPALRKVPTIASGFCRCGCNQKVRGGKKSHRRKYLPGHSQYLNPRAWKGDGRLPFQVGRDRDQFINEMLNDRPRRRGHRGGVEIRAKKERRAQREGV